MNKTILNNLFNYCCRSVLIWQIFYNSKYIWHTTVSAIKGVVYTVHMSSIVSCMIVHGQHQINSFIHECTIRLDCKPFILPKYQIEYISVIWWGKMTVLNFNYFDWLEVKEHKCPPNTQTPLVELIRVGIKMPSKLRIFFGLFKKFNPA